MTTTVRSAQATVLRAANRPSRVRAPDPLRRALRSSAALPVGLGVVGFLVAFTGSWIPSYWGDEAASVMSAERSLPSLFRLLGHVDAVHGTYYLFLHFWIGAFGASEVSTRLPSTIAAGFIVAGTFVLGRGLARRSLAITAALVAAILPQVDYIDIDARSYAINTAIAVWTTVLLLELVRRRTTGRLPWLAYALALAFGLYVFLYLGLLLVVHGAYLLSSRRFAPLRRRFAQSAGLVVLLASPIAVLGYRERTQIAFLAHRNYASIYDVFVAQWLGNPFLAVVAWALMILAVAGAIIAWWRWRERSELVVLATLWVILPTSALLALNIVNPTYEMRYLSFCAPAVALLVVAGAFRLRARWWRVAALGTVVAFAMPTDIGQREPYAMDAGSDLAQSAAFIGAHAHPGDAVVFDASMRASRRPRLGLHLYPGDYAGLRDVTLKTSYRKRDQLWDTTFPLALVSERLDATNTVWLLEISGSPNNTRGTDVRTLEELGYRLTAHHTINRTIIDKFSEGS